MSTSSEEFAAVAEQGHAPAPAHAHVNVAWVCGGDEEGRTHVVVAHQTERTPAGGGQTSSSMTDDESRYATVRIDAADVASGFRCGKHPLDDYFKRHALKNDEAGISAAYVFRRADDEEASLPRVLGFYTLSMAVVTAEQAALRAAAIRPSPTRSPPTSRKQQEAFCRAPPVAP